MPTPSSVVAIIQAANRLQVVAVERAAVDFLVERLDAGNVLSAMALGEHLSAGEIGRELQEKSRDWLNKNFGLVAAEPSFLQLPASEVAGLVESDDVEGPEEDVFAAVMAWVKGDEVGRTAELDRLLPLVRFPMITKSALVMMAEPLVARHALSTELLFETHPLFAESAQAASCPRLVPRTGQRLGGAPAPANLAFTLASAAMFDFSGEGGALLQGRAAADDHPAVCAGHVMRAGRHAAEFTVIQSDYGQQVRYLGLARPGIGIEENNVHLTDQFWGLHHPKGPLLHKAMVTHWEGMQGFEQGDVVGLLLDCDAGTLTVRKNGQRLGVAATGLTGELCWAVLMIGAGKVRIAASDPETF